MSRIIRRTASAGAVAFLLASCGGTGFDPDLRSWIPGGLSTAGAAAGAVPRPQPDQRGIISFPTYQVVVARANDTPATVAARLGIDGTRLAQHNALPPNAPLGAGQILVLSQSVPATGQPTVASRVVRDPFAGQPARNREAAAVPSSEKAPAAPATDPSQHTVAAGETAWSIARQHDVSVQDLAAWNGLPPSMALRVGQRLVIPVTGQKPPRSVGVTTMPGSGSPTPRPPSADQPLPTETTRPAAEPGPEAPVADLGATRTAASSGRFQMPVSGSIIRIYEKGKNDGIDISATAGSVVKAAGRGTVAAVTTDTAGTPIVVVRHEDNLMTVYTGLDGLNVAKGDTVSAGQAIGKAGSGGFVHFEVRKGFDSVDPEKYLN